MREKKGLREGIKGRILSLIWIESPHAGKVSATVEPLGLVMDLSPALHFEASRSTFLKTITTVESFNGPSRKILAKMHGSPLFRAPSKVFRHKETLIEPEERVLWSGARVVQVVLPLSMREKSKRGGGERKSICELRHLISVE